MDINELQLKFLSENPGWTFNHDHIHYDKEYYIPYDKEGKENKGKWIGYINTSAQNLIDSYNPSDYFKDDYYYNRMPEGHKKNYLTKHRIPLEIIKPNFIVHIDGCDILERSISYYRQCLFKYNEVIRYIHKIIGEMNVTK